jgi:flagellar hook-basal body complex protein FliE
MIDAIKNVASLSMTRDLGKIQTDSSMSSLSGGLMSPGATTGANSTGESFASVMSSMATNMVGDLKKAESASFAGINGTMDTRQVVDAVMQGQQTLQTAMAFRDKFLSAWQDITKMTI